jgi:hypothetical protein
MGGGSRERNVIQVMVGKIPLEDQGWESLDWTSLASDTDKWRDLVSRVMNFRVPYSAENFLIR